MEAFVVDKNVLAIRKTEVDTITKTSVTLQGNEVSRVQEDLIYAATYKDAMYDLTYELLERLQKHREAVSNLDEIVAMHNKAAKELIQMARSAEVSYYHPNLQSEFEEFNNFFDRDRQIIHQELERAAKEGAFKGLEGIFKQGG